MRKAYYNLHCDYSRLSINNMEEKNTVLGIDQNVEAVLCYVVAWVTGIIFLFLEKENKFVRFHAMQSLVTFLGLLILSMVISIVPIIGPIISFLLYPLGIVLWILLMYKAYQGEMYKLPYVGNFSEEQIFGKQEESTADREGPAEVETIDITEEEKKEE